MDFLPRLRIEVGRITAPDDVGSVLVADAYVLRRDPSIGEQYETFVTAHRLATQAIIDADHPAEYHKILRETFERLYRSVMSLDDPLALMAMSDAMAEGLCKKYAPDREKRNLISAVRIPYAVNCTVG